MTRINFEISDILSMKFKQVVGSGNVSNTLRRFIETIVYNNYDEQQLEKKNNEVLNKIFDLELEQKTIELQLKNLKEIKDKKQEQIEKDLQQQDKENQILYSFDPFAHLEGRVKKNEAQRCLYRVEKGKFIPEWAIQKCPENPKEYALKLINKIIEGDKYE